VHGRSDVVDGARWSTSAGLRLHRLTKSRATAGHVVEAEVSVEHQGATPPAPAARARPAERKDEHEAPPQEVSPSQAAVSRSCRGIRRWAGRTDRRRRRLGRPSRGCRAREGRIGCRFLGSWDQRRRSGGIPLVRFKEYSTSLAPFSSPTAESLSRFKCHSIKLHPIGTAVRLPRRLHAAMSPNT
jgi:hypothetical protein